MNNNTSKSTPARIGLSVSAASLLLTMGTIAIGISHQVTLALVLVGLLGLWPALRERD